MIHLPAPESMCRCRFTFHAKYQAHEQYPGLSLSRNPSQQLLPVPTALDSQTQETLHPLPLELLGLLKLLELLKLPRSLP